MNRTLLIPILAVAVAGLVRTRSAPPETTPAREVASPILPPGTDAAPEVRTPEPGWLPILFRVFRSSALPQEQVAKPMDDPALEREKIRIVEAETIAFELPLKQKVTEVVAHYLELAYRACDLRRYGDCIFYCGIILRIDRAYTVALELKEEAEKQQHAGGREEILARKVEAWRSLTDSWAPVIPYSQTFRFPRRDEWAELGGSSEPDPRAELMAIERKLREMPIDFAFVEATLGDVLDFIRDYSGLNILLDAAVRDRVDPDRRITVFVRDMVVRDALTVVLGAAGGNLYPRVTEERVVLLTGY